MSRRKQGIVAASLLLGCMLSNEGAAEMFSSIGPTYPIVETSALEMIMGKLQAKEKSGELQQLQKEAVNRSINSIKAMPAVEGIQTVAMRTQRLIDPTVKYEKAVLTDEGQVVVPAGAKINPLLVTGLSKKLVFFNGNDKAQVEAVRKLVIKDGAKVKPILVAGPWFDLTKKWKSQVFFDQKGTLSKRFGITAVPAVISQQGQYLLLEEIPARELK